MQINFHKGVFELSSPFNIRGGDIHTKINKRFKIVQLRKYLDNHESKTSNRR